MAHSFYHRELFEKELSFDTAAPLFCEAADELLRLPEQEAAPLCEALLDRMDQTYSDDILLRSYNGYVTFSSARESACICSVVSMSALW